MLSMKVSLICLMAVAVSAETLMPAQPAQPIEPSAFVRSSNHLGLAILNEFDQYNMPKNVLISPLGLAAGLAMLGHGADGPTAEQIHKALGFTDKSTIPQLVSDAIAAANTAESKTMFATSNALIVADGLNLQDSFLEALRNNFHGEMFHTSGMDKINEMIATKTDKQIAMAMSEMSPEVKMMLLNAAAFKGEWMFPFMEESTSQSKFYGRNETEFDGVTYMTKFGHFGYVYLPEQLADMVEIPYMGDQVALYAILPRDQEDDDLEDIRSSLNTTYIEKMIHQMSYRLKSTVQLPRMEWDMSHDLTGKMPKAAGTNAAFSGTDANFGPMSPNQPLHLERFQHRTRMDWIEAGRSPPDAEHDATLGAIGTPLMFEFDHPFLFFVRHKQTGQILMLGEVHTF